MNPLEPFKKASTAQLTTYRTDGRPVTTPVNVAVEHRRAYFRTYDRSGKVKRIRRNAEVRVAPGTWGNRRTAPAIRARARLLEGAESDRAAQLIASKHPLLHGLLIPLSHRLRGYRTVHVELVPLGDD